MIEIMKRFVGSECMAYTFKGQVDGKLIEVLDDALVFEKNGMLEIVNIRYIVKMKEYSKRKR